MKNALNNLSYSFKTITISTYILPLVFIGAVIVSLAGSERANSQWQQALLWLEVYYPLVIALLFAPIIPIEIEQKTWPLIKTYPVTPLGILVHKTIPAIVMALAGFFLTLLLALLLYSDFPIHTVIINSVPAIVMISALSMFLALITGNMVAALSVSFIYWLTDYIYQGQFTRLFYLFQASLPSEVVEINLLHNKLALFILGCILWLINVYLILRRTE